MIGLLRFSLVLMLSLLAWPAVAQKEVRAFVYGNSLVHHLTDTDETTVPHWLHRLAVAGGHGLALDGTWGFLRDFAATLPPEAKWSFREVPRAWDTARHAFRRADFDTILIAPANFIQYRAPDAPYEGDNPQGLTPLSATLRVIDYTANQHPAARFYIYEGWADLGSYPPSRRALRRYHDYSQGDYHDWYESYVAGLRAALPGRDITLIPVARVLSELMTGPLADLPATVFYTDDAPHGTPTLYLLASLVTYAVLYGEAPPPIDLPDSIDGAVRDLYPQLAAQVWASVSGAVLPEAAQAVLPVPGEPLDNPSLAMGLNGISDWSTQHPFIDLMKTARPWIGHLPGQWGGFDAAQVESSGVLDPAGWPTALPDGVERLETFILTDQPAGAASLAGRYRLTYAGQGRVSVGGIARDIDARPGEIWFSYRPGEGLVSVSLSAIDAADPIRDIAIVRTDHVDRHAAGEVFNPAWVARIADLRALRFMDWMATNGSQIARWEDRPLPSDYSYGRRGVPVEVMVELANLVGADPWFTMPHMADDAYVEGFARLVHDRLDARRVAYVEYSNEVWNFIFPQTHWAAAQAQARWGDAAGDDAWMQYAGLRAAQVADIWAGVYADAPERLVRVIATHTGWPGLEEPLLTAPLAQAEGLPPPVASFDAYAISGYFGHEIGGEDLAPALRGWIDDGRAAAQVTQTLRAGSLRALTDELFPYHAGVARQHGLALVMYEGGTHIVGNGELVDDDLLTAFFAAYNYSPEMASLYATAMEAYAANGGTLFNAFVDVAAPSKWGSWGALRHLDDINPRWSTLMAFNALPGDAARAGDFAGTLAGDAP